MFRDEDFPGRYIEYFQSGCKIVYVNSASFSSYGHLEDVRGRRIVIATSGRTIWAGWREHGSFITVVAAGVSVPDVVHFIAGLRVG